MWRFFASVSKADGRSKAVGPGRFLDSTKLNKVVPVQRVTLVLYYYERMHENIPDALVLSYVTLQSRNYRPTVSFCLPNYLQRVHGVLEMLQSKQLAERIKIPTHELWTIVCQ